VFEKETMQYQNDPFTLIVVAMPHEAKAVLAWLKVEEKIKLTQGLLYRGLIFKKPVLLLQTGIGKAACLPSLLQQWPIQSALLTGYCGALSPHIKAGEAILAQQILPSLTTPWASLDQKVEEALKITALQYHKASLLTVEVPLITPQQKQDAFHSTHAMGVDMENLVWALSLIEAGIPFSAVRFVLDEQTQSLAGVTQWVDAHGKPQPLKILKSLTKQPKLLLGLPRLKAMAKLAQGSLCQWIGAYFKVE